MSRTQEALAATLILPEIPPVHELLGVTTELRLSDGTIPLAAIVQSDPRLGVRANVNGTVDIINQSGQTIPALTELIVTAAQEKLIPFPAVDVAVAVAPTPQSATSAEQMMYAALSLPAGGAAIVENSNNLVPWESPLLNPDPLVNGGFIRVDVSGEIQILKGGRYLFQHSLACIRTGGDNTGRVSYAVGANDTPSASARIAADYSAADNINVLNFNRIDNYNFPPTPVPQTLQWFLITPNNATTFAYGMGIANSFLVGRLLITRYPG